jgi:hypothetical protein
VVLRKVGEVGVNIHEWIEKGSVSEEIAKRRGLIELVRCKDCKYWYFADNRIPCEQENVCGRNGIVVTLDWFCADGEREDS